MTGERGGTEGPQADLDVVHERHAEPVGDGGDIDGIADAGQRHAHLTPTRPLGLERPAGLPLEALPWHLQLVEDHPPTLEVLADRAP